jgi:catechol 2,3-dioxygenase-like lactoylglutathione lyase family enzyme
MPRSEDAMIRGVKLVSIPVRDQKRAIEFWTEKIGLRVMTDQPFDDNQRWVELGATGNSVGVVLFQMPGWDERIGKFMNITFYSEDVRKTYEELSGRGVEFVQPPKKESWGTSAVFKDQDGSQYVVSSR